MAATKGNGEVTKHDTEGAARTAPAAIVHDLAWRWERWTVWPMFILSVFFVALQLALLFYTQDMRRWEYVLTGITFLALWIAFIVDFLIRLLARKNKRQYLRDRWFELVVLAVPILRPVLPLYYLWKTPYFNRGTAQVLRQRYLITIASIAVLFLYLVSTGVYLVEHGAKGANITSWGDAMWWGIVTITTVGYGDLYPITFSGRLLGAVMMIVGLLLIGVVSGSFVNYLAEKVKEMTVEHTIRDRKIAQEEAALASSTKPPDGNAAVVTGAEKANAWAEQGAARVRQALGEVADEADSEPPVKPEKTTKDPLND